jgi:L-2-hydroxycarboxylate dehydrogenase (NAD+)
VNDRFAIDELESFCATVLEAVDVQLEHAVITAKRLVEADIRGRTGHGVIRLGPYVQRIEAGGVNLKPHIQVTHETPTSALIDGDNGLGQVIMTRATEMAIEKAETVGMGWIGTVHSNHAGAAGLYPLMAAREGMIAIYMAVANANGMPPWGGTGRLLGTNPIAIAVPSAGAPFLLDIATTVASHGSIKVKAQAGEQMPKGWVLADDGTSITDPNKAHEGSLMPIGGYKGSGLNIALGLLAGVMNGAAFGSSVIDHREALGTPTNTGQSIFVMRADLFMPADQMLASVEAHLQELRNSGTVSGDPVRLPGDQGASVEHDHQLHGVVVPTALREQFGTLADRLGVPPLGQ